MVKDEPPKGAEGLTGHSRASSSHDGAALRRLGTDGVQGGCFFAVCMPRPSQGETLLSASAATTETSDIIQPR